MLKRLESPICVERAHFLINSGLGSLTERRECAKDAINYLLRLGYTKSPHWDELVAQSGLEVIEPIEVVNVGSKRQLAFCKAVAHEYPEAISVMEATPTLSTEFYRNLELVAHFLLLSKNFKGLEELEYRLSAIPNANVAKEELEALSRIQILVLCGFYMQCKYLEFCKSFFKLERSDPDFMNVLECEHESRFITRDELLLMVTVSSIVAIPFDNYDDFLSVEDAASIERRFPQLVRCLKLLTNTSFGSFLKIWHGSIDDQCKKSLLLAHGWDCARSTMRHKIYFFYLRISNKLTISYLSRTLSIEEKLVEEEVRVLIENAHLNFEIIGDLIRYKSDHFLAAVTSKLKKNHELINQSLQFQVSNNRSLKNMVQESIIGNNASESAGNDETVYQSPKIDRARYAFDDNMDIDEINDISDVDSASFILGNESLSRTSGC